MPRKTRSRPTSETPLHTIILAAGKGTRMKSALPKTLHCIGGKPMLDHVISTARGLGAEKNHIVLGHGAELIRDWLEINPSEDLVFATQEEQLGTAHAVQQAMPDIPDDARVLVLYADVPLIRAGTLRRLIDQAGDGLAVLTAKLSDPFGYGRVVRGAKGEVLQIVEEKDASSTQRKIREINTGFMTAPAGLFRGWLDKVDNQNAKQEYYLTDVVALAAKSRKAARAVTCEDTDEVMGVNDRLQQAQQERVFQRRQADALLAQGVSMADPARFDLRGSLLCGVDVSIDVGSVFEGSVELGDSVHVGPNCVLRNAKVGAGTRIEANSVLDGAIVGRDCSIGPFARLRPEATLSDNVHVGNFVEIKKTTIGEGSKANHLAYLGDASIGSGVNVGAGVITCNYDGANKHRTEIGDGAFIGTDTQLIAPVKVGAGAYVAAGSSIARDVPADQLTICRARDQRSIKWKKPVKKTS